MTEITPGLSASRDNCGHRRVRVTRMRVMDPIVMPGMPGHRRENGWQPAGSR